MDHENELVQRPTLSFPAYAKAQRPRWVLFVGGFVMLIGILVMIAAVLNQGG